MPFAPFTTLSVGQVLTQTKTSLHGLNPTEASARLASQGTNEVASHETSPWQLFLRQLRSPFIYLLIGAALVSFGMGDVIEGMMIMAFVCINALLGFSQEYHSVHALNLLKQFVVKSARVKRAGHESAIPSRELVVGDLILLEAGDIVPADARLIETQACMVDETILTGESVQVNKSADPLASATEQAYAVTNLVFAGTTIVSGRGQAIVIATGMATAMGTISHLALETKHESSFEKGISHFSGFILRLVVVTIVGMFVLHLALHGRNNNPLELILFAIALAVSVIPEALPVVTTISLSKGALRLAKHKVVVKRLSAIEDLGSIEVLCTDKTGTLTENRMRVADTYAPNNTTALRYATLASACLGNATRQANNAFDIALWQTHKGAEQRELCQLVRLAEIPFDPMRRRNSTLVLDGKTATLIIRGAPEAILPSCVDQHNTIAPTALAWTAEQGCAGKRVLAVATKAMGEARTYAPHQEEHGFSLQGLIAFEDPIKVSTPRALKEAQQLGVAVKILTGDSPEVAGAVAKTIGLIQAHEEVLTGAAFMALDEDAQLAAARTHHVFARVSPAEKHAIIGCLEKQFEVGFLGEGINDAPGLKIANVGIVVQGASDIARETADIILLQHSLEVIVGGIREGREVFANTLKYIKATLASKFGNFYAVAISSFLIPTLPMLPIQILLLNLLSDFPMLAIATDTVDKAELHNPHSYQVRDMIKLATLLGVVSTLFDFMFFGLFFRNDPAILQTNWFMGSVLTELVFLYSVRTKLPCWLARRPSTWLTGLTITTAIITLVLPYTCFGRNVFHFHSPSSLHLAMIFSLVAIYFVTTEIVKLGYERTRAR